MPEISSQVEPARTGNRLSPRSPLGRAAAPHPATPPRPIRSFHLGRVELDLANVGDFACADVDCHPSSPACCGVPHLLLPDNEALLAGWNTFDLERTVGSRGREERMIKDHQITFHP